MRVSSRTSFARSPGGPHGPGGCLSAPAPAFLQIVRTHRSTLTRIGGAHCRRGCYPAAPPRGSGKE